MSKAGGRAKKYNDFTTVETSVNLNGVDAGLPRAVSLIAADKLFLAYSVCALLNKAGMPAA